jgi:hypothetical protein
MLVVVVVGLLMEILRVQVELVAVMLVLVHQG